MYSSFGSDELGSDALQEVLDLSLAEHQSLQGHRHEAESSRSTHQPNYMQRQQLNVQLSNLDAEIRDIEEEIAKLTSLRDDLFSRRNQVALELQETRPTAFASSNAKDTSKGKSKANSAIDFTGHFEWSDALKSKMLKVFGIQSFRLCQEGVCNANMEERDVVCVMPTGGGKSLTYQLPALLMPGCTLVLSPLIALMSDQIFHLREAGVEAVMLTGSASKEEARSIQNRLTAMALGKGGDAPDIKLCYVTPEKLAKSKTFMSLLEKLYKAGKLARFVIDEAHCVSQMGHDYRPDYQKLGTLRKMFPRVPILALSATCPPKVLKDLMLILQMKNPIQDGESAGHEGTVYFSAPLYRKNLHYSVLQKPGPLASTIKAMRQYILENHAGHSGIIYCLSKKDAETVASELHDAAKIRTGVYHADVGDAQKESIHKRWRRGDVNVVCATIAFGLGIDKGDVRFVLHHSLPKSVEGFYQESGRAGRDGKDADCVLFYRPQDATRLAQLTVNERGAQEKLHEMLRFAQNLEECRNVQFAKYFSSSSQLSVNSWTTQEKGALERCGHCDNCLRAPDSLRRQDVRLPAWQILRVASAAGRHSGRVTISQLADLARGVGGAALGVSKRTKGKGKATDKVELDLDEIAGGKIELSKEDTETLCVHLLINHYLQEDFHPTSYSVNVYVVPGPNAVRLSRLSRTDVEGGKGPTLEYSFLTKSRRRNAPEKSTKNKTQLGGTGNTIAGGSKRKAPLTEPGHENAFSVGPIGDGADSLHDDVSEVFDDAEFDTSDDDDEIDDWNFSLRRRVHARKRTRVDGPIHSSRASGLTDDDGQDVIAISSD